MGLVGKIVGGTLLVGTIAVGGAVAALKYFEPEAISYVTRVPVDNVQELQSSVYGVEQAVKDVGGAVGNTKDAIDERIRQAYDEQKELTKEAYDAGIDAAKEAYDKQVAEANEAYRQKVAQLEAAKKEAKGTVCDKAGKLYKKHCLKKN